MKDRIYQQVTSDDLGQSVTLEIQVSDLKYLYNLLEDVHKDMVGYKNIQQQILQVLKDHKFDRQFNDLPF